MDAVDRQLIQALRENGRASYAELGRLVGLSGPSVTDRINRLETAGVITGYRATVDAAALGLGVTALIGISLSDAADHEDVARRLKDLAEIEDAWFIAGDDSYMLKVRVGDVDGLERTIRLPAVRGASRVRVPRSCSPPSGRTGSGNFPKRCRRTVVEPPGDRGFRPVSPVTGKRTARRHLGGSRMDVGLKRELEEKVRAGERLTREDGIALYASDDLAWLGGLAHEVRMRKNGDVVHFNVNRHLNMTNVCTASCAYCSFQRKPGEKDAYTMRIEEAVRLAKAMEGENLTELHIVNGLHPTLPWRYYPRSLSALKEALPQVSLKAFTATEIHHFETISGLSASEILDELIEAGLESLTGGGAEIFDWEVRQHIVDHDTHWEDWSRIHRLAHEKGLKTPATMLYGHIEEPRHRVDHVLRLRELQDETGGFQVFIPLRYQHDFVDMKDGKVRNKLQARTTMATGAEALKTFAVSRLLFDNVPHVKVFWVMHGVQTAQLALQHGADDMDGSVVEYKITHDADNYGTPNKLGREDLLDLIRDAGFRPVERNTRYEIIREYLGPDAGRRESPQPMRV